MFLIGWKSHFLPSTFFSVFTRFLHRQVGLVRNSCKTVHDSGIFAHQMREIYKCQLCEGKDSCVLSQQRPKPLIVLANHRWLIPRINGLTGCPQVRPSHFLFPAPLSLSNDPPQFNRRHHCRRCGRLVCSSCSTKKMVVEGCRENPARVCDQCYSYFNKE